MAATEGNAKDYIGNVYYLPTKEYLVYDDQNIRLDHKLGDINSLTTTDKTSLVGAISEVKTSQNTSNSETVGSGVLYNSGLTVSAQSTPNMTVSVPSGIAYLTSGKRITPISNLSIAIATADTTKIRKDIIYINSSEVISYLKGTSLSLKGSRTYTVTTNFTVGNTLTVCGVTLTATTSSTDSTKFAVGTTISDTVANIAIALNANSVINGTYAASSSVANFILTEIISGGGNTPTTATYTGTGVITNGTATTSTPAIAPTLPTGGVLLAEINVPAGATSITSANIIDKRNIIKSNTDLMSAINVNSSDISYISYQLIASKFSSLAKAITELNTGTKKILFIPDGTYYISSPLIISSDNVLVSLAQNAKIISTVSAINTFIITGKNCTIQGGTIEYPLAWNGENRAYTSNESVISIQASGAHIKDIHITNVYKIGIHTLNVDDVIITGCTIEGNYPVANWTGVETAHFAVNFDPGDTVTGGNYIVSNNIFKTCVQGVFVGNWGVGVGYGINISDNVFEAIRNHGIYDSNGMGHVIVGNVFNKCQTAVACVAKFSTICNNTCYTSTTGNNDDIVGFSLRECENSVVTGNIFKGDGAINSTIIGLLNLTETMIVNNVIADNTIDCVGGNCLAISVGNNTTTSLCKNNIIKNNIIKCNGRQWLGLISIFISSGVAYDNHVEGNIITIVNNTWGIYMSNQSHAIITNNTVKFEFNSISTDTLTALYSSNVDNSIITNNIFKCIGSYGSNLTLQGVYEDGACSANMYSMNNIDYSSASLSGKSEMSIQATSNKFNNMITGTFTA